MDKMPGAYRKYVLKTEENPNLKQDPFLLAHLKDYRSLMPMAQEKTKPMFLLKPGDGAIGAHYQAVQACYKDFEDLTKNIISAIDSNQN